MPPKQPNTVLINFGPLLQPLREYCTREGVKLSDVVRASVAAKIKAKAALAGLRGPGRPAKPKEVQP